MFSRKKREEAHEDWVRAGHEDHVLGVIDLARGVAVRAGDLSPLIRALAVEEVYLSPDPQGRLAVSTSDGQRFVHVFSSPVRLAASYPAEADEVTLQAVRLPALARAWDDATGVRLDAGSEAELSLDAAQVQQVRATAAGLPTRAALTAVDGELMRFAGGPEEVTPLDRQVVAAIAEAGDLAAVGAEVSRYVASLDGVGGRDWPVYLVRGLDAGADGVLEAVNRIMGSGGAVVLLDGAATWLAEAVGDGARYAVALGSTSQLRTS